MVPHLSRGAGRMLCVLLFRPPGEFHVRGLARVAGLSPALVSRELKQLERTGLVRQRVIGTAKLYSANRSSILYPEVRRLLLKTSFFGEALRGRLEKLPVRYVVLFGSFAAGDERERSDVDVLVVGDVAEELLLKAVVPMERETQRDINYILWSPAEFRKKSAGHSGLLKDMIRKPLVMIVGDAHEFRKAAAGRSP